MDDIVAFLNDRYAEDEWWAREASRHPLGGVTPDGEHWHWECETTDQPVPIDPALDQYVTGVDHSPVGLRSIEEYPSRVGMLSHLVISNQQELLSTDAGHIARHDPARVLADIAAKRRIVEWVLSQQTPGSTIGDDFMFPLYALAAAYSDHPAYQERWRI